MNPPQVVVLESTRVEVPTQVSTCEDSLVLEFPEKNCVETNIDMYTHMHTQPNYIALKSRDITLPTKVHLVKDIVVAVVTYGCESWTIRKLSAKELMLLNCDVGNDT